MNPGNEQTTLWTGMMWLGIGFLALGMAPFIALGATILNQPTILLLSLLALVVGTAIFMSVAKRAWGVRVEKRAIQRLRLPEGWRKEANLPLARGDLDLLIQSPTGLRFAVEIKSYQGVSVHRSAFGRSEELRYRDGRRFSKDPVAQVLAASEEVDGKPVIWLPEAGKARAIRMRCGVLVVQGRERELLKGIGAINSWF